MPLPATALKATYTNSGNSLKRIAHRKHKQPITIVEPNPLWAQRFLQTKHRIEAALDPTTVLSINHVGSTSVPHLPAKNIIDIDLVMPDIHAEQTYVPALEAAGFTFLFREPGWHDHRFFVDENPNAYPINLHVFGPNCPEVARHVIFRDWLVKNPEDRELYADVKRECARATVEAGESLQEYTERKGEMIQEILARAFRDMGDVI